jgi:hypothetical protein
MLRKIGRSSCRYCSLLGIVLLAVVTGQFRSAFGADTAPTGQVYDLRERPLPSIRAGTVIGRTAPKYWSHLIIKSQPRVAQGDVNDVSQLTLSLARLLSVSIVANVKAIDAGGSGGAPRYTLDRVALGLGTRIDGRDVIINSDTQSQLGANLSLLARTVLSSTEAEMELIKQVLRSRTSLIFDVPTISLLKQEHRRMIVRHALLVDAVSGQLNTLVWLIDKNDAGDYTQAVGSMSLLASNTLEERLLSVDANEFTLGIPSSKAIAMVRIPPGQAIAIPPHLASTASMPRFTEESARQLDSGLRDLVRLAPRQPSTVRENPQTPAATTSRVPGK